MGGTVVPHEWVWSALAAEPGIGVLVVTAERGDVRVLFANNQVAAMVHPEWSGRDLIGRKWSEYMPSEWCAEWSVVVARVAADGEAVIKRGVWRGTQYYTTLRAIPAGEGDKAREGSAAAGEHVLVISRAVPTSEEAEFLASSRASGVAEALDADGVYLTGVALDLLSPRELEVLALLGMGLSVEETARALHRSPDTVKSHRKAIAEKLGTSDRQVLARIADRAGLKVKDAGLRK